MRRIISSGIQVQRIMEIIMHSGKRSFGASVVRVVAIIAVVTLAPMAASADSTNLQASQPGLTLGGRASYERPKDADSGALSGGAQLRLHLTAQRLQKSRRVRRQVGGLSHRQHLLARTMLGSSPRMHPCSPRWALRTALLSPARRKSFGLHSSHRQRRHLRDAVHPER